VTDPYFGREQTKAKHFILRRYLQALAFKILRFFDITYVDGFSGPWETKTEDFVDSSFMIAIASQNILLILEEFGPISFLEMWEMILPVYMLRVTNVKDVCVDLAKSGKIEQTWSGRARKPSDQDRLELKRG
jgi:hypothetical protein